MQDSDNQGGFKDKNKTFAGNFLGYYESTCKIEHFLDISFNYFLHCLILWAKEALNIHRFQVVWSIFKEFELPLKRHFKL